MTITDVLVRLEMLDGRKWTTIARPSQPWVEIAASQTWWEVMGTYIVEGIRHILFGADHMLFVLGLLLIVKDRWMLLKTVTAFTVAHSITLAIATLGYAEAPVLPLNAAIALSILFLGPEIVRSWRGETSFTIRHPWVVAFAFGLLHGFGFASALTSAGLPRRTCRWRWSASMSASNWGSSVLSLLILAMERSFRVLEIRWPRWVQALPGYTVGSARSVLDYSESGDFAGSDTMRNLHRPEKAVDAPQSPHAPDAFYDIAERFQPKVMRLRARGCYRSFVYGLLNAKTF